MGLSSLEQAVASVVSLLKAKEPVPDQLEEGIRHLRKCVKNITVKDSGDSGEVYQIGLRVHSLSTKH